MKGLLLKEYYTGTRYCRVHMAAILLFVVVSAFSNSSSFFMGYAMIFSGIIPVYLLSYDEKSRWNTFVEAFPYTRRDIVTVKYVAALAVLGATAVLLLLAQGVRAAVMRDVDMASGLGSLLVFLCAGLVIPSVMLPVTFWFGVEKGRVVTILFIMVFGGALGALGAMALDTTPAEITAYFGTAAAFSVPAAALLFWLSWRLAIRLYEKREL